MLFADAAVRTLVVPVALGWRLNLDTVMLGFPSVVWQAGTDPVVVDGFAHGIDATCAVHLARVLTHIAQAHLQEGTVFVVTTARYAVSLVANVPDCTIGVMEAGAWLPYLFALNLGITLEARGAGAQGTVVPGLAFGVEAADVGQTADVLALAVDAGLLVGTVVVVATALYAAVVVTDESGQAFTVSCTLGLRLVLDAHNVGVATVSRQTRAVRVVVDGTAQGVTTTGAEHAARVLADAVDARLVRRAPLVRPTAEDALVALADVPQGTVGVDLALLWWFGWHWPALDPGISDETSLARADRPVSGSDAESIDAARPRQFAQVLTLPSVTRLARQALIVRPTAINAQVVFANLAKRAFAVPLAPFFPYFGTVNVRVSRQPGQAYADKAVVCGAAIRIDTTHARETAGVLAAVADARLVEGTGVVRAAGVHTGALLADAPDGAVAVVVAIILARDDALDVGIPAESRRTGADGLVADRKALGILAAVAVVAGILALTTDAGLVEGAVAIAATALNTDVRLADLANIAVTVMDALRSRLHLNSAAVVVGVPLVARPTGAQRPVHHGPTVGVLPARVLDMARVGALGVDAGLVKGAVRVAATSRGAFPSFADLSWVAGRIG